MISGGRHLRSLVPQRRTAVNSSLLFSEIRYRTNLVFSSNSYGVPPSKDLKRSNTSSLTSYLQSEDIDANFRGVGQVIFLNSAKSGQVILFSLALGDPSLAALSAIGVFTSTSTSRLIGLDRQAWKNGLLGYNGALIGCAVSVFGPSFIPYAVAATVAGAVAAPIVSASLKSATTVPQWTWAFNIVTLTSMLRTRPLLEIPTTDVSVVPTTVENAIGVTDLALSPVAGISQIFVVESHLTGAGIVAAVGMYSPGLALHALGGSATGCVVGVLIGADVSDVAAGLYGYNSALSSMAVGTFFVDSQRTRVLSCASAAASAVLFGSIHSAFGDFGVSCLTLPFCTVASACFLLEGQVPGLFISKVPHSPEKNSV